MWTLSIPSNLNEVTSFLIPTQVIISIAALLRVGTNSMCLSLYFLRRVRHLLILKFA